MSRCTIKTKKADSYIVVGIDGGVSWFGQLWTARSNESLDTVDLPADELDTQSNSQLMEKLLEWEIDRSDQYTAAVYEYIGLDLDPVKVPRPQKVQRSST